MIQMFAILAAFLGVMPVQASASPPSWQSITALTPKQVTFFTPYTYYASTGYCTAANTKAWDCGANCEANADFKPVTSGGNGDSIPYWYVGYDPKLDTVIVSHEGTNAAKEFLITDDDFVLTRLDPTLFPGLSSDIEVHSGFANAQARTATDVLAAVKRTMSKYDTWNVTLSSHSLGAAIALLDSVYLQLWLPSRTSFRTIGYGLPRVGTQAFANYVDVHLHLTHINNKEDPVPNVPPTYLGFVHPRGEIHIQDSEEWVACPGQDNPSVECTTGDLGILPGNVDDHDGPYNGITMGC